jgi:hypothetical protein
VFVNSSVEHLYLQDLRINLRLQYLVVSLEYLAISLDYFSVSLEYLAVSLEYFPVSLEYLADIKTVISILSEAYHMILMSTVYSCALRSTH